MRRSLAALAFLLIACRATTEPDIGLARADLRAAPTTAVVAGQRVGMDVYAWRDFMPSSPPDGKPLMVVVRVHATDGATLNAAIAADSLWVINGEQAWAARAVPRSAGGAFLEIAADNGPKWGPGVRVDVVVRLRDGAGAVVYLRAADQLINRTD